MTDLQGEVRSVPERDVPALVVEWLGPRQWCYTGTIPLGRRVAVVSSRLPRLVDPHGVWLQGMRAALNRLCDAQAVALIGGGTAGHEFVLRGAERRRIPRIVVRCSDPHKLSPRGRKQAAPEPCWRAPELLRADLWPDSLAADDFVDATPTEVSRTPSRDRAAIAWADEIIVLAVRTGGNLHSILKQRLLKPNPCVMLADFRGLQSRRARAELIELGAKPWTASNVLPVQTSMCLDPCDKPPADSVPATGVIPCPTANGWNFLTHTTRACTGAWPGQSRDDYLDSLLDGRADADHSCVQALMRIVEQRRLVASSRAIRGGFPVVSFTAVPLAELPRLHVFRSHRARWDFEPYGLCIRRDRLSSYDVRPVTYAADSQWECLSNGDRPYFQHVHQPDAHPGAPNRRATSLDWSVEQEWRHLGDLDLSRFASDDVILFVPTQSEARKLLAISPWPVTVLGTWSQ